jgi:hypothetical protein
MLAAIFAASGSHVARGGFFSLRRNTPSPAATAETDAMGHIVSQSQPDADQGQYITTYNVYGEEK